MIDKSQSAGGLRARYSGGETVIGSAWKVREVENSVVGGEGDRFEFERWLPPDGERFDKRTDYEVDSEGRLIRLGDQIDEELYPAMGLVFHHVEFPGDPRPAVSGASVGVFGSYRIFSGWADTPRNRELGLFKEKEENMSDNKPTTEGYKGFEIERGVIDGVRYCTLKTPELDWNLWHFFDKPGADGRPITVRVQDYSCPREVIGHRDEWDFWESKALDRDKLPSPFKPDEILDHLDWLFGTEPSFIPFTEEDFREAIGPYKGIPVFCVLGRRQALGEDGSIRETVGAAFDAGFRTWLYSVDGLADDEIEVKHNETGLSLGVWARGKGHSCFQYQGQILNAKIEHRAVSPEEVRDEYEKMRSSLSSSQNQKMVEEQNRSLGYEETSWLRAKLPSGDIVESPMPQAKDGWEETWSDRWQEGECEYGEHNDPWMPKVYLLAWIDDKGVLSDALIELPKGPLFDCWFGDMDGVLLRAKCKPGLRVLTSVLEAKKFRRKVKTKSEGDVSSVTSILGEGNRAVCSVPYAVGTTEEQERTRAEGLHQVTLAIHDPNPNWPEDGHPSLSTSEFADGRTEFLPLLQGPEQPRQPYDDSYWPERHAPKPRTK